LGEGGGGLGSGVSRTVEPEVRRPLTILLAAALIGVAVVAAVDAFHGSSPEQSIAPESGTEPREPSVSIPEPRTPKWPELLRRTIRLDRAVGAAWEEFGVLDPGTYALSARFDLPHDADVDVWFESVTGPGTIDLLGRGHPRDCRAKEGRDVCVTTLEFRQRDAEVLRLLARKLSLGPMVIRLRIAFEQIPSA
jgi:hypothetical protein